MKKLNTKGFGVIEGLLIFVIVAIVGGTIFYVYRANKNATSGNDGTTIAKNEKDGETEQSKDPYEGWATCNDKIRNVSIKYPSDWQNNNDDELSPCKPYTDNSNLDKIFEVYSPKAKNKSFRIWYIPLGKPYSEDENLQYSDKYSVLSVEPITTATGKSLNLVSYADEYNQNPDAVSSIALTDQDYDIGQTFRGDPTISTSNKKKPFVWKFDLGAFKGGGDAESYLMEVYKEHPSYQDVINVLKSITY